MEHVCAACNRRRSSSYHQRHPLTPGRKPKPGVCSRCVKRLFLTEPREKPHKEVHHHHYYEVHHHHYVSHFGDFEEVTSPELPAFRAELPSETRQHSYGWVDNETPPPVYPGTKPILPKVERQWQKGAGGDTYRDSIAHNNTDSVELHSLW